MNLIIERIAKLLAVRSIITIMLTVGMLFLLSGFWNPNETILTLYSTSYGAIITYFFTKEKEERETNQIVEPNQQVQKNQINPAYYKR